jgi:site-specific DNA-methyltransferase (adenine-specific)
MIKERASRNQTININPSDMPLLSEIIKLNSLATVTDILNKVIHQSIFEAIDYLPSEFIDLLIIDPPYNLTKQYGNTKFSQMTIEDYSLWLNEWLSKIVRCLKPKASIYVCCDWKSSNAIYKALSKYFKVRNRITWEREKGRGAKSNWKNCAEDIYFCTVSEDYYFDVDAVKLKKKIIAPYKDLEGNPKDWEDTADGKYRLTYPSNMWTDISIPFWSMPENTDHPTQKPEKLIAKLILASSNKGDFIFDPFLGSGTTAVVAKKLDRVYSGVESEEIYCLMALKRLQLANTNTTIQGYFDGYFWERNSLSSQKKCLKN